jgi:hypothetical protein
MANHHHQSTPTQDMTTGARLERSDSLKRARGSPMGNHWHFGAESYRRGLPLDPDYGRKVVAKSQLLNTRMPTRSPARAIDIQLDYERGRFAAPNVRAARTVGTKKKGPGSGPSP